MNANNLCDGADRRVTRDADAAWNLGSRAMVAMMSEVQSGADPRAVLARYARLTPAMVTAAGADRWPPSLSSIPGGRAVR